MAIEPLQNLTIIEEMENFLSRKRPPEDIRHKVDVSYKIENQSIIIFEIIPRWDKPDEKIESPVAKCTFVKTKNIWKIFWLRANLKWYLYEPKSGVKSLREFLDVVEEDKHGCFWG
jgi:hypothetical protein